MGRGDVDPGPGRDIRDYTASQALLNQGLAHDAQMQRIIDERAAEWHSVIE